MDPRDTVGRIYKEDHHTLLHTKHESSGPCGFGEEDFFLCFSHDDPRAWPVWIYEGDHYTLLHTKYESSGPCGFGEEDFFYVFSHCKSMGAICCHGNQSSDPTWLKT